MKIFPTDQIFSISKPAAFEAIALDVFRLQAQECRVFKQFIENLNRNPQEVNRMEHIPFMPIEFFKSHEIISDAKNVDVVFSSSGTTGMITSKHFVTDISLYERSFLGGFKHFYGDIQDYTILALLPSYLEREGSSLIYMVDHLIRESAAPKSGYFLYDHEALYDALQQQKHSGRKTLLIGVTYALLDFLDKYHIEFPQLIVMETGGMKGKRPEMLREELHQQLKSGFGVESVHSEYGMTELLSQAYSKGMGIFACPPWMKVMTRDTNDPLTMLPNGKTGGLNIIDLANLNSCSFIATQDLGKVFPDGTFEVLGRFDNSDIRGCNLLVQ